jgi:signal transduction histidine kinase/CheY-like chemotaxis protein
MSEMCVRVRQVFLLPYDFSLAKIALLSLLFFVSSLISSHSSFAVQGRTPPVLEIDNPRKVSLLPYLQVLVDQRGDYTLARLKSDLNDGSSTARLWQSLDKHRDLPVLSDSVYWFRLRVSNHGYDAFQGLLVLPFAREDEISVHIMSARGNRDYDTGSSMVFSSRPIPHHYFLFPLALEQKAHQELIIRVKGQPRQVQEGLALWEHAAYYNDGTEQIGHWMFMGVLLCCAVLALLNGVRLRRPAAYVLAVYIFSLVALELCLYGYGYRYLWPNQPYWNEQSPLFFLGLSSAFSLLFVNLFSGFSHSYRAVYLASIAASVLVLILTFVTQWGPYQGLMRASLLLGIAGVFVFWQLFLLIRRDLLGYHEHRPLLLVWGLTLLASAAYFLSKEGSLVSLDFDGFEWVILVQVVGLTIILLDPGSYRRERRAPGNVSSRVRDQLLERMSQEIRTPVSGIVGVAELLENTRLDQDQARYVELVQASSRGLLYAIDDILDYTHLSEKGPSLEAETFDFRNLLREIISTYCFRARRKNLELCCDVDSTVAQWLKGDEQRLRQLLTNIIDHAIRYSDSGTITLDITRDPLVSGQILIVLHGCNMDVELDQAQAFLSLADAEIDVEGVKDNWGLGFLICKKLVGVLEGRIDLATAEDGGLLLTFSLPLSEGADKDGCRDSLDPGGEISPSLSGLNLLWIGRSGAFLEALTRGARENQVHLLALNSLAESDRVLSRAEASNRSIDVVIVDSVLLGDDSGCAAAHQTLVAHQRQHKIRIVVLCDAPAEIQILAKTLDPEWLLEKPPLVSDVFTLIERKMQAVVQLDTTTTQGGELAISKGILTAKQSKVLSVLVAEDNSVSQMVIEKMLTQLGHHVTVVENGALALELYRHCLGADERWQQFDLILMDCEMPELDGFAACARMRGLEHQFQKVAAPIVALTAQRSEAVDERCRVSGFNQVLLKPLSKERLTSVLSRHCADTGFNVDA